MVFVSVTFDGAIMAPLIVTAILVIDDGARPPSPGQVTRPDVLPPSSVVPLMMLQFTVRVLALAIPAINVAKNVAGRILQNLIVMVVNLLSVAC